MEISRIFIKYFLIDNTLSYVVHRDHSSKFQGQFSNIKEITSESHVEFIWAGEDLVLFMKATNNMQCIQPFSLWYFDNLESYFKFLLRNVAFFLWLRQTQWNVTSYLFAENMATRRALLTTEVLQLY